MKRLLSIAVLFSFIMTFMHTVYASSPNNAVNSVKKEIQRLLLDNGYNANVDVLNRKDEKTFLKYLRNNNKVAELDIKLRKDNFICSNDGKAVFEICDKNTHNAVMFAFEKYNDVKGDSILVIHIYDETTDSIKLTYAQKITCNLHVSNYFIYRDKATMQLRDFNATSFVCGLGRTLACGAFSAMLFAFIPASNAVGMTCGTAFAWVCSHA